MAVVIYYCRSDLLSVAFLVWLGPLGKGSLLKGSFDIDKRVRSIDLPVPLPVPTPPPHTLPSPFPFALIFHRAGPQAPPPGKPIGTESHPFANPVKLPLRFCLSLREPPQSRALYGPIPV